MVEGTQSTEAGDVCVPVFAQNLPRASNAACFVPHAQGSVPDGAQGVGVGAVDGAPVCHTCVLFLGPIPGSPASGAPKLQHLPALLQGHPPFCWHVGLNTAVPLQLPAPFRLL